ncbi:septum formation protein [Jatrophihabitans sp. GAS493]|uniref:Maf family protein n=1 Tax=Jatrophihabitans sp. GAS493 TaxID=1907575 RepID=UPI000BB8E77D|nr:Maf family protein [Jatrophihabitans sp. GAS493]SOD72030.1 septum formation protein [Jatrophihabitans sp. GAS493]
MRFILASGSPARLATLRAAGVEPEVVVSGVDEESIRATSVPKLVAALAEVKARAVAAELHRPTATTPADALVLTDALVLANALVLGCDSLLELDGQPLGKPGDAATATNRWRQLRGRSAKLHTGHALLRVDDGEVTARRVEVGSTEVHFADVTDAEIADYVATGEPLEVAGAFTIDGRGGWFIERISGDHHNVVGLSLPVLRRMLAEIGFGIADLPRPG